MAKLETLKKPKGLKGLPGLGRKERMPPLPELSAPVAQVISYVDPALGNLTRALGDERLAKKVLKLKEKWPDGTFPELVTVEWLERKRIKYGYQVWVLGGRAIRGGQVLDIVVDMGIRMMVWEVNGNYWHNRTGGVARDQAQKLALLGLSIWGKKVGSVITLWESRIMTDSASKRDHLFNLALQGIEIGP